MRIRPAVPEDKFAVSILLEDLVRARKRSARADVDYALATYIANPNGILCSLAEDVNGQLLGLQSLIFAIEGNDLGTPVGWGTIGTHVSPSAARMGIGSRLFAATKVAAEEAKLEYIEAHINDSNAEAQAYYEKMGFQTYRIVDGAVCKAYRVLESRSAR